MATEKKTILNTLKTQLETITTGNGYSVTVNRVVLGYRENLYDLEAGKLPAYMIIEDEPDERIASIGTDEVWKMRPSLFAYLKLTADLEDTFNKMSADLHKLFNAGSFSLGANCIEAVILDIEPTIETKDVLQFMARTEITYKFAKATP